LHTLKHLNESENYESDLLVFLQCTAPLTLPEDIEGTIQALLEENADSALAVTPCYHFLWRHNKQKGAVGINHDKSVRPLRQEREPQYIETGAVYAMHTRGFLAARHRFFGKTAMYVMPSERCLEIDEPGDLFVAEALVLSQQRRRRLEALPNPVAALVLDFDGVFTNNRVLVFDDGREAVMCDRGDGWGLAQLRKRCLPILVLSSEENLVVRVRCDKLSLLCKHGVDDKLTILEEWLRQRRLNPSRVVYLGNDVNDIGCLKAVGCGVAVANAHHEAQTAAQFTLSKEGGRGAIRELTDLIVERMEG
jgi:N-acylneuraminate cytidylyltransferase